jgi:Outer membrane protein beta-barrel domain
MLTTTQRVIFGGALVLAAAAAEAQRTQVIPPIGGGIRVINAQPIGEFRNYVQDGWGVGGDFRWFPAKQEVFSLRADAGFLLYGQQSTYECFGTGCRITVKITTSNNIFSGLVGPELQAPSGPVRPYVNAMAGWTVFWTQSSADGQDSNDNAFTTTNYRDNLFTSAVGGGVRIPIGQKIKLDFNVRRNFNGRARYLTRDSFGDGTSTTPVVRESEVNMWTYALGVSFGH